MLTQIDVMKDTVITGNPRHDKLLHMVHERGYASVETLAQALEVSAQTIRRDIKKLSDEQLLIRHHGGAGRRSSVVNQAYELRQVSQTGEKEAIAAMIADYIPDRCTVFITPGSTTEIIAKHLINRQGLRVITNSLRVANVLYGKNDFDVLVPGGHIRSHNGGIIGSSAQEFVTRFRVDHLITSCGSIEEDGTLLDFDFDEVAIARSMMENARNLLLAADSTKFVGSAAVELGNLTECSALFTDRNPGEPLGSLLRQHKVELHVAG